MATTNKLKSAIVELIRLITQRGCSICFVPPTGDKETGGTFEAARLRIEISKERTGRPQSSHVYALAHEYRHLCQYLAMDGEDSWLYALDFVHKDDKKANARQELDADKWAMSFMHERKIPIPKTLHTFIKDREEYFKAELGETI